MKRARLADVATQAGVSEATVSRVVNDVRGVSAETQQKVLAALDVLGYERPERLRRRSAGLIGLVVPELENPIFPAFAQVIDTALARHGFTPVLCAHTPGGVTEDEYIEILLERGVSGIIFISGLHADTAADHGRYALLAKRRIPAVFVNGYAEDIDATFFSTDATAAGGLAIAHLVSMGHRRIGFASGPERFVPVRRQLEGFSTAMQTIVGTSETGISELVALGSFGVEGGHASAISLLAAGATAVVCGSDLIALGVVRAIRQRNLNVPADVSVIGHDDSPLMAFTDPPLTTVRQPVRELGLAAVHALLEEIAGHRTPHAEFLYHPELVARASTGPAASPFIQSLVEESQAESIMPPSNANW